MLSVDGSDFKIQEQVPLWSGWWSFKYNGPGLRYEIALCIQTGWIVWINGPFAPGPWTDLNIFRYGLKKMLLPRERVEADSGYPDFKVDGPEDHCPSLGQHRAKSDVRARHETVNRRMKQFFILRNIFRHEIKKHVFVFDAIAVITQISIQYGREPLYCVPYRTYN